ncbi:hypothetical protein DPMN_018403 [Dreissena polymorpha]|uniref:Uncharacterized protein n=1 Tax=Dreissena polymorpha TaxID=45954 RepID=A0A9D4NGH7_DREPO|nr:hypothetical protein DPMN_018403 [Dreissena polymorpha]
MGSLDATSCRPETPEWFPQHVECTGYSCPSTLPLSSSGQPLEILTCISTQGPPRPSSALPPLLSPSLFWRCSETTIYMYLQKITIQLSDPSKFWESGKSAGEEFCLVILRSLQENLLQVTVPPMATCMCQLLIELCSANDASYLDFLDNHHFLFNHCFFST